MSGEFRRITEIRAPRRGSRRRVVYLDGDPWRSITSGVLRELGLKLDDEIEPSEVESRARSLEAPEARERALRLIAYRERSAHELEQRLSEDGYPADLTRAVVSDFRDSGLVDDRRFAESYVRTGLHVRGLGRQRLERELSKRGVDDVLITEVLGQTAPADDERERLIGLATRLRRPSDSADRLAARLVRRGFRPGDALAVARDLLRTTGHDADL
jgi:regulatory protein